MNMDHQFSKKDPSFKKPGNIWFKVEPDTNIRSKIFHQHLGNQDVVITDVSVYKTPLVALGNGPGSSVPGGSNDSGAQLTPLDYQAFVVMETNVGVYISLERYEKGVQIGCSKVSRKRIVNYVGNSLRARKKPVELLKRGASYYPLDSLLEILKIESNRDFELIKNNSMHFAERIFYDVARTGLLDSTVSNELLEKVETDFIVDTRKNFDECQDVIITDVSVYKTPLGVLGCSSVAGGSNDSGIQLTPLDYHVFVVMETNVGVYISLERYDKGVQIGCSKISREMVVNYEASMRERRKPVTLLKQDTSIYRMDELLKILENECNIKYDINNNNCKHFAKKIFDKAARTEHWDFKPPKGFLEGIGETVMCGMAIAVPLILRSIILRR